MDEKPDQIIGHIEAQRDELGRNLNELETRVRASTNWRTYYDRNPMLAVGAALGGGLLLGTVLSAKTRSGHDSSSREPTTTRTRPVTTAAATGGAMGFAASSASSTPASSMVSSPVTAQQRREVAETFDQIKAALIAFGIAKAKEFLNQAIPGLESHLSNAEQRGRQHSSGTMATAPEWSSPGSPQREAGSSHSWESAGAASHHDPVPAL